MIIRFDAQLYFANINFFQRQIGRMGECERQRLESSHHQFCQYQLDGQQRHSCLEIDIVTDLKNAGLEVFFTGVKGPVRDALVKGHVIEKIEKPILYECAGCC
ncbi:MAG: sodium-independent anion transporter [Saprospiraceae bacterium]